MAVKPSGKKISALNNASSYNIIKHAESKIFKSLPDRDKIKKIQARHKKYAAGVKSKDCPVTLEANNYGF